MSEKTIATGLRLGEQGSALLSKNLSAPHGKFDWFYSGAEFCENLLRGPGWHERELEFFLKRGTRVCFLTPPLSEKGLRALRPVFKRLAALSRDPSVRGSAEVTVNDFGALQLAADTGLRLPLSAGRLLYEDIFFVDRTKMLVINGEAVRLFASLGVKRFEFSTTGRRLAGNLAEAGRYGFKPEDISITLHYPFLNLTSGRSCAVGVPDIRPQDSVLGISCRRECRLCRFEIRQPLINEKLMIRGNTVFLRFPRKFYSAARTLERRRVDRLVYSPFP